MRQLITSPAFSVTLAICFCQGCQRSQEMADAKKQEMADAKKLEGTWVEVHALAEEKPKGRGAYYTWGFEGEKVVRGHTETLDGDPLIGSSHVGTYKLDATARPKAIDIVLKSPLGEDWKYQGIYEFEGDTLKLCLAEERRPTTFDNGRLYTLKRPSHE